VTEPEIRERIAHLEELRATALANVNALNGAIEDCEFWLGRALAPAEPDKKLRIADKAP
jgi:hypothetical protein